MDKKLRIILWMVILFAVFTIGCSSRTEDSHLMEEEIVQSDMEELSDEADSSASKVGLDGESAPKNIKQKLIYRASINIEVMETLSPLIKSIQSFVEEHDGYLENIEQYVRGHDPVSNEPLEAVYMRIRIPHAHYSKTLQTIEEIGTVIHKNSSVEDVTLQYSDIESTLKMYKIEQDRLLEMLENESSDIKDIIAIEQRLSQVRVEIEKQESARRALESQIDYDTIELEMMQVRRESDINSAKSFGSRIRAAFIRSIDWVMIISQQVILVAATMLIPIMILSAIAGIVYLIFVIIKKRKKE